MITQFRTKLVLLLFLSAIPIFASVSLSHAAFLSTDIPITIGSNFFEERDIVQYDPPNFSLYLSSEAALGIPLGVNIDALGFLGSDIFFSVDIPTAINGVNYDGRDLILYEGSDFSKLLEGSSLGIPNTACIDAATVLEDGSIIFSLDIPVTLEGISFQPNDLVRYDGSSLSLYFSGSDNGIPENANIDGVWVSPSGEVLFSLDIPCSLNGLEVKDKDIIKWSEGSFSTHFDGLLAGIPDGSDVDALSSGIDDGGGIEPYEGDFDDDGDVDGSDLATLAAKSDLLDLSTFASDFGRVNGPLHQD